MESRAPGVKQSRFDESLQHIATEVSVPTLEATVQDTEGKNIIIDLHQLKRRNQRRRQEAHTVHHITSQLLGGQENDSSLSSPTALLKTFNDILTERIHDAVSSLDIRQNVWKQTILQLQSQVHEQECILQERLRNHEHRVV